MLLPLLGIGNPSWQVFGLFKARKRLLFLRFWWFIHEFSEIYTLLFLKICYNDSRFDAVLSEISANKWADFTKKSTFHRNKMPCWEDVLSQHGIFYGSGFVPWYALGLYALCQFQFCVFLILSWLVPAYRKKTSQLPFKYSPKRKKCRKISTFSSIILASLTSIPRTQRALKAWYWCHYDNQSNETRGLRARIGCFRLQLIEKLANRNIYEFSKWL